MGNVPGFRGFHGPSLLFLFSQLCSRLHSQWQSGAGKYWQGTHEERGEDGILSLYQKMSLYFYHQLHFQLSQGLDQIAQAAKCLNRFSSSSFVQDSKQGSLKAPGIKKPSSPRFVQNAKDEKENTNDETVRPISAGGLPTSIMLSHFESIAVSKVERNSR